MRRSRASRPQVVYLPNIIRLLLCEVRLASEADLDAALLDLLGSSLDEVQILFDEYPPWTVAELHQDQACEGTQTIASGTSFNIDLGCSAEGVEGKLGASAWSHRLVELPETGAYTFEFSSTRATELWIELRNCARQGLASIHYEVEVMHPKPGSPAVLLLPDLPAGVYVLRLMQKESQPELMVGVSVKFGWP